MTSTQANAETAQQLIERLESSSRDFVRDDIEETERNISRNKKVTILVLVAMVPLVLGQIALIVQAMQTASSSSVSSMSMVSFLGGWS